MLKKLWRRVQHPRLIAGDVRHRLVKGRDTVIGWYASYHQKRGSPGRVVRIPGQRTKMWLPRSWGITVAQRRFGVFEPWTRDVINRVVKPGMIAVELGAC